MIGKHQDRTITTNDRRKVVVPAVCWGLMLLFAGADPGKTMGARDDTPSRLTYEHHVRSILKAMCFHCHGEEQELPSGMELCLVRLMRVGGDSGPAIVPGDAASSLLWQQIDADEMPKGSKKLTANQKRIINKSINQGATTVRPEPDHVEDARFTPEDLAHWAFQPVTRPPVPAPAGYRLLSPIDGFVAVRLAEHSLPFSPAADRHTLIRRATLDLTGLPPTPAEVDTFVADKAPDAYDRLIDRLLASPQYGERWGRFWLDVARYSDSNGLDENIAHGNAWRYRDYVIAAFNSDKPYDRFLHEQLAGDLMEAGDHATRVELNIATGFLSLGPKVLAEQDVVKMTLDIIDEQIDTIGRSLMGLTLGCSRCHDHKFDPLTTRDYYALAGIFKSTRTMESFKALARWNETSIARPEQQRLFDEHQQKIEAAQKVVEETTKAANEQLRKQLGPDAELPEKPGEKYPEETKKKLAMQQAALKQLEQSLPTLPMAMGVVDQEVTDLAVHIRGSHLSLGEIVPRRVPELLSHVGSSPFDRQQSGRRELAAWLTHPDHPLTSRVMANRIWRWHFGRGIVSSTDNFGKLGAAPTHPDLLDHLASGMVERGWSIKQVHRCIMLSSTYRMSSRFDGRSARLDPANQWLWRFPLRRTGGRGDARFPAGGQWPAGPEHGWFHAARGES